MIAKDLKHYQKLLLSKRGELTRTLATDRDPLRNADARFADSADQSAHSLETSVRVRLRETDSRLLRAIESALARIDRNAFGVCEICAEPIPSARLNVVPWARQCRDCKEQQDTGAFRPERVARSSTQQI